MARVRIVAWDIPGGTHSEMVGEFESVQMTGRELRDQDGTTILNFYDEVWFNVETGNGWYDWTAEAV